MTTPIAPKSITGIVRGCGKRVKGGLYVCSGLSPFGLPIKNFIIDPPLPFDGDQFRAPLIIEKDGKNHLLMWVGAEYYPYVSDYIEEIRSFGGSKRLPSNFPIEKLDKGSMLFLVHPKAIIVDHEFLPAVDYCPAEIEKHTETNGEYCVGHAYQIAEPNVGSFKRKLGDTEYEVYPHSMGTVECDYRAGIFLRLPVSHFDLVKRDGKVDPVITGKKTKLPVNIEDE